MNEQYLFTDNDLDITLDDLSRRDYRFRKWKTATIKIAGELQKSDYDDKATILSGCASQLIFKQQEKSLKLLKTHFCKHRICPLCAWRKRLVWLQKLHISLNTIQNLYKEKRLKFKLIFLTISQKNCRIDDLNKEINKMSKAWDRFVDDNLAKTPFYPKIFPSDGYFRALEVTNKLINYEVWCNVHYHVLIVAPQDYAKKSFVTHPEWVKAWRKAMQLDYDPTAHVKFIKFGQQSEVLKYLVKPLNYDLWIEETLRIYKDQLHTIPNRTSNYDSLLNGMIQQLKHCRQFSTSGLIRRYMPRSSPEEHEDYIKIKESQIAEGGKKDGLPNLKFVWNDNNYYLNTFW